MLDVLDGSRGVFLEPLAGSRSFLLGTLGGSTTSTTFDSSSNLNSTSSLSCLRLLLDQACRFFVEVATPFGVYSGTLSNSGSHVSFSHKGVTDCINPFSIEGGGGLVFSFKLLHNGSQSGLQTYIRNLSVRVHFEFDQSNQFVVSNIQITMHFVIVAF